MLWIGFDDTGQNTHQPAGHIDSFIGLASQNRFVVQRSITSSKPMAQARGRLTFYEGYAGLVVYTG